MSDTPRDIILGVLASHAGEWIGNGKPDAHCRCGHRGRLGELHSAHVADAVIAELNKDTALVILPTREKWGWADGSVAIDWDAPGTPIQLEINPGDVTFASLDYARDVAAGILAAIAEVEGPKADD